MTQFKQVSLSNFSMHDAMFFEIYINITLYSIKLYKIVYERYQTQRHKVIFFKTIVFNKIKNIRYAPANRFLC